MSIGRWRFLPLPVLLLIAAVFLVDLLTPLGGTAWVLYLPVILVPVWLGNLENADTLRRQIVTASALCSVLVIVGVFITHPDDLTWPRARNRGMGLLALWLTTFSGVIICRRSRQLTQAVTTLQKEIVRHSETSRLLEKAEERLRLAMEASGMGTFDLAVPTGKVICSATHLRMLGFETVSDGEITAEMWRSCIHPDDLARVLEAREQALHHRSAYAIEYRINRPDNGEIVWLAVFGHYHYNESGEGVRFLGVSFDITRRKELEREVLEIVAREQRQIGQELHDGVGQELTGLGLMAQSLALRLSEDAAEKRVVLRLVAGFDTLRRRVRELSRGLIPVHVESRGLSAALDDLAAGTTDVSGISVIAECPEWVELSDHESAVHLFRIAQEAVGNALRHARPQHIRLSLLTEPNGLRLRIKDDGIGIQSGPDQSDGLGLRIMKYRAELIGGVLQITPSQGGGTVVTCTLPWSKGNVQKESGRCRRQD
jgi:PAS domain S-box-containing protein